MRTLALEGIQFNMISLMEQIISSIVALKADVLFVKKTQDSRVISVIRDYIKCVVPFTIQNKMKIFA